MIGRRLSSLIDRLRYLVALARVVRAQEKAADPEVSLSSWNQRHSLGGSTWRVARASRYTEAPVLANSKYGMVEAMPHQSETMTFVLARALSPTRPGAVDTSAEGTVADFTYAMM